MGTIPNSDRERILAAIKSLVDPATGHAPTKQVFMARAGWTPRRFLQHFATYEEAVRAAGLEYVRANRTRTREEMLSAYGRAVRQCGKLPSQPEFWAATRHHSATLIRQVGGWAAAPAAFVDFAGADPQWADVVAVIQRDLPRQEAFRRLRVRQRTTHVTASSGGHRAAGPLAAEPQVDPAGCAPSGLANALGSGGDTLAAADLPDSLLPLCPSALSPSSAAGAPSGLANEGDGGCLVPSAFCLSPASPLSTFHSPLSPASPLCGPPLSVPGLSFCPINEAGVIVLFTLLLRRLGFNIVAMQTGYPDCLAQREVAPGKWQLVRIEFEYESRSFAQHRHTPAGCDLIVCWRHNWPDCPPELEVLELEPLVL